MSECKSLCLSVQIFVVKHVNDCGYACDHMWLCMKTTIAATNVNMAATHVIVCGYACEYM